MIRLKKLYEILYLLTLHCRLQSKRTEILASFDLHCPIAALDDQNYRLAQLKCYPEHPFHAGYTVEQSISNTKWSVKLSFSYIFAYDM